MTFTKILVTILASLTLSFTVMADDVGTPSSPEDQCSENDSYEDASGNWQSCEDLEESESDYSDEWPESVDEPETADDSGEYEQETASE